jgi:hypothetical protein
MADVPKLHQLALASVDAREGLQSFIAQQCAKFSGRCSS